MKKYSGSSAVGFFEQIQNRIKSFANDMVAKVRSSFQSVKKKVNDFFKSMSLDNIKSKIRDAGSRIKKNVKQIFSG